MQRTRSGRRSAGSPTSRRDPRVLPAWLQRLLVVRRAFPASGRLQFLTEECARLRGTAPSRGRHLGAGAGGRTPSIRRWLSQPPRRGPRPSRPGPGTRPCGRRAHAGRRGGPRSGCGRSRRTRGRTGPRAARRCRGAGRGAGTPGAAGVPSVWEVAEGVADQAEPDGEPADPDRERIVGLVIRDTDLLAGRTGTAPVRPGRPGRSAAPSSGVIRWSPWPGIRPNLPRRSAGRCRAARCSEASRGTAFHEWLEQRFGRGAADRRCRVAGRRRRRRRPLAGDPELSEALKAAFEAERVGGPVAVGGRGRVRDPDRRPDGPRPDRRCVRRRTRRAATTSWTGRPASKQAGLGGGRSGRSPCSSRRTGWPGPHWRRCRWIRCERRSTTCGTTPPSGPPTCSTAPAWPRCSRPVETASLTRRRQVQVRIAMPRVCGAVGHVEFWTRAAGSASPRRNAETGRGDRGH